MYDLHCPYYTQFVSMGPLCWRICECAVPNMIENEYGNEPQASEYLWT